MTRWVLAMVVGLLAWPVQAQNWGNLDGLLFAHLTQSGRAEASYWLPEHADPAHAARALGIVYEHIPGSAGNVDIAVGVFVNQGGAWAFGGPVSGVFGLEPRAANFAPGHVDLSTTTLKPGEPRCCPTGVTRWRIDLTTLTGQRLP